MKILSLETTCDETAAAVVTDQLEVLSSVVASQDDLHRKYGGVVPELASRAHVQRILPVIEQALRKAGITLGDLDAVAVANTPGLAGSLLVGLVAAKTLCLALGLPLIAVDHLQAHIFACRLAAGQDIFPCVGLVVSGGHTSLYRCRDALDFQLLGSTRDDAAGESYDKVAAMLSLPYPGGPSVDRAARNGDPAAFQFPRTFLNDEDHLDFSFSGLKTAVRYQIAGPGKVDFSQLNLPPQRIADLAASFQEAVVDCLVGKAELAMRWTGLQTLCVGGGVAANSRLRQRLTESAQQHGWELHIAPLALCTDNAVMGAIAVERLKAGLVEPLELDIQPGMVRSGASA
ncbi:MAG: tRNA (adenosine(37)-N6)-threonylcarbamoyltransferase complex transferase subunit TsaD [Planctomycetales bacterium]|nr:tRNA (adenosine(37)-N6)-threonylcarbamoyltransferase complex transferase subunit TsaD [Planctomycetales bacterium]NIM08542.1 tRNA (adenosine(37)-N6)-threonylcarbamoyltransferase complex transferase subunit TsaD [Planctomycetales bacterium]NIN08013.1 tRNA (adenosine(37)-N6)-threonylcarbamoyltransferase complex transferase subunit TsaD [Planctomycetales bacterium]NIN77142.1 tRNA (adenosine(37)-N6)-threonylcarbamoyltransferase complex transferase subunit TsaD [Planctomycetales bacterium]NIO3432